MRAVETVLALVVLATAVAASARWLRAPAPSLLVAAGLVVGLLPGVPAVRVTPDVVGLIVLPPLLYAAAEELPWRDLRAVWQPVTLLASGLVLTSAAAVGLVAALVTPLAASMAILLGAVLASTDPVAVTALGRRLALPARVQALVQGESLFNDATSLVLFRVAATIAVAGGSVSIGRSAGQFVLLAGGGVAVGALVAAGIGLIRRRTEDPVLETVVALVTPYAAYVVAEGLHASGVTAVVVAGLMLGSWAPRLTNGVIRLQLHAVYGTVVFLLESVVFSLIGLELPVLIRELSGEQAWPLQALAITGALLAVRILWVFPMSAALQYRRGTPLSWRIPAVVTWAGARGVVPLAAALSIPLVTDSGAPLPGRDLVVLLTTSVIVITLLVQGFTLAPLVRRSGIAIAPETKVSEEAAARQRMAEAGLARLDQLVGAEAVPDAVAERLRRELHTRIEHATAEEPAKAPLPYRDARRELIAVEGAELARLHAAGTVSDATRRRLQRVLDLEDARLAE
jgi:CPA1 family monovalent cation:H+ antiporter